MTKEEVKALVKSIIDAPSCCAELKEAAQTWLAQADTPQAAEAMRVLLAEAEADIIPIDGLIAFTASAKGKARLGEELAAKFHQHGLKIKAQGALYCDCPACAGALELVAHKKELLG